MWKAKRMNTARIVVLTVAVGVGGVAAHPAYGSDRKPLIRRNARPDAFAKVAGSIAGATQL